MASERKSWIGVDVSEQELVVGIMPDDVKRTFAYTEGGIDELIGFVKPFAPTIVVFESSGGIERRAVAQLYAAGLPVSIVNPRRVRDYAKAAQLLAKTDEIDSLALAGFARTFEPVAQAMPDEESKTLRGLVARRSQLVSMLVEEKNRRHRADGTMAADIETHIHWLEKRLSDFNDRIGAAIEKNPQWRERGKIIKSMTGSGDVLCATLIAELPELGMIDRKEIAALVGVAPFNRDSGKISRPRSTWGGRSHLRKVLYMACQAATIHNPVIRAHKERLIRNGKKPKVAIVACMRKMLVTLNAMVKNNTEWSQCYRNSFTPC